MLNQTFLWGRSQNKLRQEERWLESCCLIGLFLAALILFVVNLGSLPLLDLQEATIAQVAKEIWQASEGSLTWLFPTLWGKPYFEHPPLVQGLIALAYGVGGVNELTTRFPGAILASISVLILYSIGREIFVVRIPALFSALVYLTLLPVIHQARLAMLDGPILCFELLTIWGMLRSRRDLRWTLVTGIGLSALLLTKGSMGITLATMVVLFLLWDTPRLINSVYFWFGLLLGIVPAFTWYILQWYKYQSLSSDILGQFLDRISVVTASTPSSVADYLCGFLHYPLPWLIFAFYGLKSAWFHQHWGWARLILVWIGVYLTAISLITSDFSGYVVALYPALALAVGMQLDRIRHSPSNIIYPRFWTIGFGLMLALSVAAGLYLIWQDYMDLALILIFISLTLTFAVTTLLVSKGDRQFVGLLFWGMYVSLFLLINSEHWIWELKQDYPLQTIAALIDNHVPRQEIVYTSSPQSRPALNFYSGHLVVPASRKTLTASWNQSPPPFLLVDSKTLAQLNLEAIHIFNNPQTDPHSWFLITKKQN